MLTTVKYMCGSVISTMLTFIFSGLGSLAHFSEDSGESSNQEEGYENEGEQSNDGNDADDMNYIDEQLEQSYTSGL